MQAGRRVMARREGGRENVYAAGSSCARPEGQRARYTLQEKEDRKGVGGSTKGCFNRLLSSVAKQEEEKVTPPVRNYLADCAEDERARVSPGKDDEEARRARSREKETE